MENIDNIWKFIRGDLSFKEFDAWFYSQNLSEDQIDSDFYQEFILFPTNTTNDIDNLRDKLREHVQRHLQCGCLAMADSTFTVMGSDEEETIFSRLVKIKDYGEKRYWLALYKCLTCGQPWLVSEDQRIYDVQCFKRLTCAEKAAIITNNAWPLYCQTYEELLRTARDSGIKWSFSDLDGSLTWAVEDLLIERADITLQEIAELVGISAKNVRQILATQSQKNNTPPSTS